MRSRSASEASSVDQYKSLIRQSLATAVTKVAGLDPGLIPEDAEISPELLQALVNNQVSPDQIQIITDSEGRTRIQSKVDLSHILSRPEQGRFYIPSGRNDEDASQTEFFTQEEDASKQLHQVGGVARCENVDGASPRPGAEKITASRTTKRGTKASSGPGGGRREDMRDSKAIKHNKAKLNKKKDLTPYDSQERAEDKEEPFLAGMPRDKRDSSLPVLVQKPGKRPTGKRKGVKDKGKKKGGKKLTLRQPEVEETIPKIQEVIPEIQEIQESELPPVAVVDETGMSSPEMKSDESEPDFNFVRGEFSPEPPHFQEEDIAMETGEIEQQLPFSVPGEDDTMQVEVEDNDQAARLRSNNQEARAAKRAAAAAKRKEEVERRRKMREEQIKKEREEQERQAALQRELEDQRRKGEEERRLRKQIRIEEEERERLAAEEAERRQRLDAERERRAKEEFQRKLEEMRKKQQEEDERKKALMLQTLKEEEERKAAEQLMLSKMAKNERLEYERVKKEEEEERKRRESEERLRRAEEARVAMEEAKRLAEELARKQAELEARLRFSRSILEESSRLNQAHSVNRAFIFSYFELLQWLGLDIPEFELAKLADFGM